MSIPIPSDTHNQLEAQLSDAFKEEENDEDGFLSIKTPKELSDSDSDTDDTDRLLLAKTYSPETPDNPFSLPLGLEASMMSMDIGASVVMSSSVINTEVCHAHLMYMVALYVESM